MDLETFTSRRNFSVLSGFNLDIVGIQEFILKIPHKTLTNYNIEIGYNGEELGTTIIFKKDLTLMESEKSDSGRIMKVVLDGITIINVYGYQPG
jgi:exonuclease III